MPALAQISLDAIHSWWNLAWGGTLKPAVLWWKHDQLFLLGAFIFEDLAVTAYQVLGPHIGLDVGLGSGLAQG